MKQILKYKEFITEKMHETPETLISELLQRLKRKVESFFGESSSDSDVDTFDMNVSKERKKSDMMSFSDLGITLDSIEISKYSKMYDNLKFKFSDNDFMYDVTITIDIKDAVVEDSEKEFGVDDIKDCFIKFKKYDTDKFDLIGQKSKNIKIKDISEDLLINLKIELDEETGSDDSEMFEIETED